jgi:flagellar P-ring protein precursor FlgI
MPRLFAKLDGFERALFTLAIVLAFFFTASPLFAAKVKDITNIVGVRENQLIGYGLVVGLQGTGDGTTSKFTAQSLANLLQSANLNINQNDIKSKNIAAVMVTTKLPAFGRQGDAMDVMVSSIGDAKSLEGGTLLLTPLKGLDGRIYAISQGSITVGGFNSGGGVGQKNHTTAGKVINGAIIEREVGYDLYNKEYATLSLEHSSFENAIRIQDTINAFYGVKVAIAMDPRTIKLKKPDTLSMIEFLAAIEDFSIETDRVQKIIIQERTGTVISGVDTTVKPVNITHGNFSIAIDEKFLDAQKGEKTITIANVTNALQRLGASPKDIISILQAIKKAGALDAELEII